MDRAEAKLDSSVVTPVRASGRRRFSRTVSSGSMGEEGASGLALLVSCIGRRLTMGQHTPYEIDAVQARLPAGMQMAGFYSYGEFAPHARTRSCELHNQTMTVTLLGEA